MKTSNKIEVRMKILAVLLGLLMTGMFAFAGSSPFLIPFQGRLTNPQGVPYTNGQYTIIFNLYDQPVGGTVLWSETHQKVGVINGMVNLFLGSINSSLSNVDFSQTRHLGITIDADGNPNTPDPEMVPRQMIIPAFSAKNSEKLAGYDWTSIFVSNSPVGPIPGGKIADSSILQTKIATRTVASSAPIGGIALSGVANTNYYTIAGQGNSVPIPELVATLQTTGKPVRIELVPGVVTNGLSACGILVSGSADVIQTIIHVFRNGTEIAQFVLRFDQTFSGGTRDLFIPASAVSALDFPPAGNTQYQIYYQLPNTNSTFGIYNTRLMCYEP